MGSYRVALDSQSASVGLYTFLSVHRAIGQESSFVDDTAYTYESLALGCRRYFGRVPREIMDEIMGLLSTREDHLIYVEDFSSRPINGGRFTSSDGDAKGVLQMFSSRDSAPLDLWHCTASLEWGQKNLSKRDSRHWMYYLGSFWWLLPGSSS